MALTLSLEGWRRTRRKLAHRFPACALALECDQLRPPRVGPLNVASLDGLLPPVPQEQDAELSSFFFPRTLPEPRKHCVFALVLVVVLVRNPDRVLRDEDCTGLRGSAGSLDSQTTRTFSPYYQQQGRWKGSGFFSTHRMATCGCYTSSICKRRAGWWQPYSCTPTRRMQATCSCSHSRRLAACRAAGPAHGGHQGRGTDSPGELKRATPLLAGLLGCKANEGQSLAILALPLWLLSPGLLC